MNGIYDFEKYRTPYLDEEMLMKLKAKKRTRKLLILSGIAMIFMLILSIVILYMISVTNPELLRISVVIFTGYIMLGTILLVGLIRKKEIDYEYINS
jgi:membrane protein YdbS with pleckstrin-like domain